MKNTPFIWFGIGIAFVLFIYFFVAQFSTLDQKLELASKSYREGEMADMIATRKEAFNQALAIYRDLEKEYAPTYGNGKLDYNLGNSYFQLEEYPKAILYYLRAMNLAPRNENIQANLNVARTKLGITSEHKNSLSSQIFFFHNKLSLPEKLQLFFGLTLLLFILGSTLIWKPFPSLKGLIILTSICLFALSCSLFYTQFIEPSNAVILKANLLYKDAGQQYAKVLEQPIAPGTVVTVLESTQNGKWLKIATQEGIVGFIPYESIEII